MIDYFHIIAAFASGFTMDILSTFVLHYTVKNKAFLAATTNTLVYACILFVFVDINNDHTLAIPYLLGVFFGGIIGIKLKARIEKNERHRSS